MIVSQSNSIAMDGLTSGSSRRRFTARLSREALGTTSAASKYMTYPGAWATETCCAILGASAMTSGSRSHARYVTAKLASRDDETGKRVRLFPSAIRTYS